MFSDLPLQCLENAHLHAQIYSQTLYIFANKCVSFYLKTLPGIPAGISTSLCLFSKSIAYHGKIECTITFNQSIKYRPLPLPTTFFRLSLFTSKIMSLQAKMQAILALKSVIWYKIHLCSTYFRVLTRGSHQTVLSTISMTISLVSEP